MAAGFPRDPRTEMNITEKLKARLQHPSLLRGDLRLLRYQLTRPDVVPVQGVMLPVGDHMTPFIRKTLYSGAYEYDEARLLKRRLQPHHTVVELGGGLGLLASLCCTVVPAERVFVYEANPELEASLRETFRLNAIEPTLKLYALSSGDGVMQFFIREAFWLSSGLENDLIDPVREVQVPVRDFDAEMATLPHPPDFLICDIEGGEYDLFMGSELSGIHRILCEVHPHLLSAKKVEALRQALEAKGFALLEVTGKDDVWYLERD